MNELLKTLRLGFYVCALPLVATAIASAHSWINVDDDSLATQLDQIEEIQVVPAGVGEVIADVNPHVKHNLRIDQSGGVSGQILTRGGSDIYGTPDLNVTLNYRGNAVASATTDQSGQFRFENVSAGAYTFIASSPTSITTFGVYVYADEALQPASNEIQLNVAAAGSNVTGVRNLLNSEVQAVAYTYTPNEAELPVIDEVMQVDRNEDGSLSGRVVPLQWLESQTRFNLTGNYVYLFDASGMAAQVPVDANGNYRIENVNPGIYDFVSFGPHGAAAMSIQVTGLESIAGNSADVTFASAKSGNLDNG
ncbi:MAG: carboxypeptidase-like regulatory domain-containing protein, partial [Pirellulaceae bacterium]